MRDCFFIQMIRFPKGKSTSPAIIILGFLSILNNSTFNFPVNASAESTSARALASNSAKFVYASEVELCRFHSHCTTYSSFTGRFLLLSSFSLIPLFMFLSCSSSFSFYPSSSSTSSSSSYSSESGIPAWKSPSRIRDPERSSYFFFWGES